MDLPSVTGCKYLFFFVTKTMITTSIATDGVTMINNITRTTATVTEAVVPMVGLVGGPVFGSAMILNMINFLHCNY